MESGYDRGWYEIVMSKQVPINFLGIVGQDHSDSKFNWLHVDIFWIALFIWGNLCEISMT